MNRLRALLRENREAGFSLSELLVVSLLLSLVLILAGGMLISSLSTQQRVTSMTTATSTGQLVSRSVQQGIRNASAFQVKTATTFGQLLRSRTAIVNAAGTTTWRCQAWFRAATGNFYTKNSASAMVVEPTTLAHLSTWSLIASGVTLPTGTTAAFTAGSSRVTLAVQVAATNAKATRIATTIVARKQSDTGTAPTTCF